MKEHIKEMVKFQADQIRAKIEGGSLYGEIVDMNDVDQLILAAYLIGEAENRQPRVFGIVAESAAGTSTNTP